MSVSTLDFKRDVNTKVTKSIRNIFLHLQYDADNISAERNSVFNKSSFLGLR